MLDDLFDLLIFQQKLNLNFFLNKFDESLSHNVKLANYSWFNLGGDAKYFFKPKNKNQIFEPYQNAYVEYLKIESNGLCLQTKYFCDKKSKTIKYKFNF